MFKEEFSVGDRVRIIKKSCGHATPSCPCEGKIGTIIEHPYENEYKFAVEIVGWCGYNKEHLQLVEGGSMSKCEELKGRIEALSNGWDKEADDVLQEIVKGSIYYSFDITRYGDENGKMRGIVKVYQENSSWSSEFHYSSQCEKMEAFKNALLCLLENSDIKKDIVGQEVKADIEGKIYKVKVLGEV